MKIDVINDINGTTTTRVTSIFLNIYVFISVNRDFIGNVGLGGNESLIFDRYSQIMINSVLIGLRLGWFDNWLVLNVFWFGLVEVDNQVFFGHDWLFDSLIVIKITWLLGLFNSHFLLDYWVSNQRLIVLNIILSINKINF